MLLLGDGDMLRLGGASRFSLRFVRWYTIHEENDTGFYRVAIHGYLCSLHDVDGREVLSFQWHPAVSSPVIYPHFHLGTGAQIGRRELHGCHIPTGMIALEQVIRLAIEELGVKSLRDDWDDVLREGQAAFEQRNPA